MPIKGITDVRRNLKKLAQDIVGPKAEKAVTEVLIIAGGYSALLTPVDTSYLINSQFRKVTTTKGRVTGLLGYTAAYAAAVHAASGKLKGQPRANFGVTRAGAEFGGGTGVGNYWDPDAEPGFLAKAFENSDARADIDAAVERNMKI